MRFLMKMIKFLFYRLLLVFILLSSVAVFLFTTTPGFYLSIKMAKLFLPGNLQIEQGSGRLVDQFTVAKLTYSDEKNTISIENIHVHWSLHALIHSRELLIKQFVAQKINVQPKGLTSTQPSLHLRYPIIIQQASIKALQFAAIDLQNITLTATLTNETWQIKQLQAHQGRQRIQLQGKFIPHYPYNADALLQFSSLANNPTAIQGAFKLGGDWDLYHWQGQLQRPATLNVHGYLKNGFDVYTLATWQKLQWPLTQSHQLQSSHGQLKIIGTLANLMITSEGDLQAPISTQFTINAKRNLQQLTAQGSASLTQGKISFNANYDNQQKTLQGTLLPTIPGLVTSLNLNGHWQSSEEADLAITLAKGHYQKAELQPLAFAGGTLRIALGKKQLHAEGNFTLDANKNAKLSLTLPNLKLSQLISQQQPLSGELVVAINSLDFLKDLNPAINAASGQLQMRLKAQGTLYKPVIVGDINLRNGSLVLPAGIDLHPIALQLTSKDKHWTTKGSIGSRGKTLLVKGSGEFIPVMQGIIQVDGQDFPLVQTEEYQIAISPKLKFDFKPNALTLTGDLLIPQASIKPRMFTSSVNLSDDIVYRGVQPTNPNPFPISTQIHLAMGQHVEIAIKGLRGFLDGAIDLHQRPNEPLRANGELSIRDGKYNAYGQDLTINQGQLLFTGGLVENPGIKLRAIRQFNNATASFAGSNRLFDFNAANVQTLDFGGQTTVGIQMSGRLNAPKLQLFSVPANLSQADILSMLLLGKPANQANQSGGQLLLTAISSMNLDSGTKGLQLLEQLKKSLGGFDVNVENNTQYNQKTNQMMETTSFVLSKALSHRLYLSYNLGSTQTGGNLLTLRYLLNKFFSVQVSASPVASGIDLLYTH